MINKEICLELEKALDSNPGVPLIDLLFNVLSFKYPTRTAKHNTGKKQQFKPSNADFLTALKHYNKHRELDRSK